jgi:hypothetical protein
MVWPVKNENFQNCSSYDFKNNEGVRCQAVIDIGKIIKKIKTQAKCSS